jgi:hypothetical protein
MSFRDVAMSTLRLGSRRPALGFCAVVILILASASGPPVNAPVRAATDETPGAIVGSPRSELDALALAQRIDQLIEASWKADRIEPAPSADDSEFLRRVYLDLAGKIPSVGEARAFLDDSDPEKRRKVVERLLARATFPAHMGRTLRDLMLQGANNNLQLQSAFQFEPWLRLRLGENTPYDKLVSELLTYTSLNPQPVRASLGGEPNPSLFYQAAELKPENLAASTSRIFLGLQLECAQCHNHPFAKWKREQFWGFAAFFAGIDARNPQNVAAANANNPDRRGIQIPGTNTTVEPSLLDGSEPAWKPGESKRVLMARWVTSPENPFFARAAVNRVWHHFFGRGLIDPVDDLDDSNPPSHPEVMEELTRQFVYHKFDIQYLVRAITATRAYQLSSQTTHASQDDPKYFARMPLRSMTAEQLFDSLAEATGFQDPNPLPRGAFVIGGNAARGTFLTKFADSGPTKTDYQATILQALTLMNGQVTGNATTVTSGETLRATIDAPFLDTPKRIEILFLATLTRRPTSTELAKFQEHVERADSPDLQKTALGDIFWALLNSAEFVLNH